MSDWQIGRFFWAFSKCDHTFFMIWNQHLSWFMGTLQGHFRNRQSSTATQFFKGIPSSSHRGGWSRRAKQPGSKCDICFIWSPHVRESRPKVDSGFQALDSGFRMSGFRIPKIWIPDSKFFEWGFRIPNVWIPDSKGLDSGFQNV